MNLKKIVSAVSALAILGSTVVAFANTTTYTGPTADKETRLSTILDGTAFGDGETVAQVAAKADLAAVGSYTGWSYHHAMQDAATSSNINANRQSQLKINSNGFQIVGISGDQNGTKGAYLAYKPVIGDDEVFYSFDVDVTSKGKYDLADVDGRGVKIANTYESGLETSTFYGNITTAGKHTVYLTFKPSNNYCTISVDGEQKKKGTLGTASTGIYIEAPYSGERAADIQISNFRYGLVNNNADATYTTGDIAQYKTTDGYDKDATAAILTITANETMEGFTVTHDGNTLSTETKINVGSPVSIGVIVPGVRDRSYLNQRFTIGYYAE